MNKERNLDRLTFAALELEPILDHFVFVGGCTTVLHVTDKAAADVRATNDVDVIVDVHTQANYHRICSRLRKLGFREDAESGVICRWQLDGLTLDVLPVNERVLGFNNRWYSEAVLHAFDYPLHNDLCIRVTRTPWFLATKLDAFRDRGKGDFLASHDLEDIMTVVDGRPALVAEVTAAPENVRRFISTEIAALIAEPRFMDALGGLVLEGGDSPARAMEAERRLQHIALLHRDSSNTGNGVSGNAKRKD